MGLSVLLAVMLLSQTVAGTTQDVLDLQQVFALGKQKYDQLDFQACIDEMTKIVSQLQGKIESSLELTGEEQSYYYQALEYRALAHYNMAEEDAAKADFRSLVEFSPGYDLSDELASPMIRQFFDGVKKQIIGYLNIVTTPSGATIIVDGAEIGVSNIEAYPLLTGTHRVEASLRGYLPSSQELEINPDGTTDFSVSLERSNATLFIRTSPPGAEVFLDGVAVGTSTGTAGADYAETAVKVGLSLEQISADMAIPYVELGAHQIIVSKECYTSHRFRISVEEAVDLYLQEPIVLEPSMGDLELKGIPAEAQIFLRGEEMDRGRADYDGLCSGEYDIEVYHQYGSYEGSATIFNDRNTELKVALRPTLVYIGPEFRGQLDEELQYSAGQRLRDLFGGLTSMRYIPPENDSVRQLLAESQLSPSDFASLVTSAGATGPVPAELYATVKAALRRLRANLLAVAVFQERKLGLRFRVFLFGTEGAFADSFVVDLDDRSRIERALQRLNYSFPFERSWLGITAVDTRMHEGTAVIAVQPGSPAAEAGVTAGAIIYAIEGNPVAGYREVTTALGGKQPGDSLVIEFAMGRERDSKSVVLGKSPVLLPLYSQSFNYNAALAEMKLSASLNTGNETGRIANFNAGMALAHFGAWEDSISYLRQIDLGDKPGINQGTVEFYLGFCFENLGYQAEAVNHYRRALEYETATFDSNDGPLVAPRVQQKVQQLGGAQ